MNGWIFDESISPNARLRQGDFIKFESEESSLRKFGIVVTADCDLDNRKHANTLTLVAVASAEVVLENYLIPEDCEKKRDLIENYVFDTLSVGKDQEKEVRLALVREAVENGKLSDDQTNLRAANFVLGIHSEIPIPIYKELMSKSNIKPKKLEDLVQQVKSRGDLLILPDTEEFGVKAGIAWMRQIWQVPITEVAVRTSEVGKRRGEKMARLDSPFRYRLTQLMGQVFSDIGLPNIPDSVNKNLEDAFKNA